MVRMRGTLRAQDCPERGVPPQRRGGGIPHQGRQPLPPSSEECWAHGASQVGFVLPDSNDAMFCLLQPTCVCSANDRGVHQGAHVNFITHKFEIHLHYNHLIILSPAAVL